jgi:hypothetical protein
MTTRAKILHGVATLLALFFCYFLVGQFLMEGCFDRIAGPNCHSKLASWIDLTVTAVALIYILSLFFRQQTNPRSSLADKRPWDAILWWEIRRIPYNLLLLLLGGFTGIVIQLVGTHFAEPGEDIVEPLAMLFGAIAFGVFANIFYTFGWTTELLWCWGDTRRTEMTRPKVFRVGMIVSSIITVLPAILIPVAWFIFGFHHAVPNVE